NQLPEKCRKVFILSRREHLTNKEIADQLNISVKTVENQMTIALRKLKSSLTKISSIFLLFLRYSIAERHLRTPLPYSIRSTPKIFHFVLGVRSIRHALQI